LGKRENRQIQRRAYVVKRPLEARVSITRRTRLEAFVESLIRL